MSDAAVALVDPVGLLAVDRSPRRNRDSRSAGRVVDPEMESMPSQDRVVERIGDSVQLAAPDPGPRSRADRGLINACLAELASRSLARGGIDYGEGEDRNGDLPGSAWARPTSHEGAAKLLLGDLILPRRTARARRPS